MDICDAVDPTTQLQPDGEHSTQTGYNNIGDAMAAALVSVVTPPAPLMGDINGDGVVNATDFAILAANFGQGVTGGWSQGELNGDGVVNATDFDLLAANFGDSANGWVAVAPSDRTALDAFAASHGLLADVPESAGMSVAGVGGSSVFGGAGDRSQE